MNLKAIFESLVPENIKNIPLVSAAMEIFLENLKKNSYIAIDIHKIYENFISNDSTPVDESKKKLKTALLDIYMSELFKTIKKIQNDKNIQEKFEELGITDAPVNNPAVQVLNTEYFLSIKNFKENKGTLDGIKYAYSLAKYLENNTDDFQLGINEVKPFHLRTEGTVINEMYREIVHELAHPLGFTYEYKRIVQESMTDLFGLTPVYNVDSIEIRQLNGTFDVFTALSNDSEIEQSFLDRGYTEEEYNAMILDGTIVVHLNKVVSSISDISLSSGLYRTVLFSDGSYIYQEPNPITISYKNSSGIDIKTFDGHYSLFLDYFITYNINYTDEILFEDRSSLSDTFEISDSSITEIFDCLIYSTTGFYLTSSDTYYLVDGDGLDPPNQFYITAL